MKFEDFVNEKKTAPKTLKAKCDFCDQDTEHEIDTKPPKGVGKKGKHTAVCKNCGVVSWHKK